MTTKLTANTNEAFTDDELDSVNGGYSWNEFKADVVGAAKALRQGIGDGYRSAQKMLP
ncbi:hypothetical protein JQ620_33685 [Bradyrhizobium sp. AUGA SZCCT0274]|uniref:hypothetical protein n=1 Tax=Bradyrhizobium sp. AUGA SZCCT0274 TaxID=2807670 RepID=UPI001BA789AC|nr:hypothetical protein [Bradyrhizobium sp. AUGA SZCCT0274]MBR1245047.1 hypothetical protein [Bradyrhizobium sp. AUGA SZCCT0274]